MTGAPGAPGGPGSPASRGRRRAITRIAVYGGMAALAPVACSTGLTERAFYFPTRGAFVTPSGYRDVAIRTPDGLTLHGWFMPARGADVAEGGARGPAVLFCHGNAGNVSLHEAFADFLPAHGLHTLLFDYRSYGRSERGRLSRWALREDALAAFDALLGMPGVDAGRVAVCGQSLGAAFALAVAAERPAARGAAVVSGFSTWRGVAGDHLPVVGPMLTRRGLEPVESIARLAPRPVLVVHGGRDAIVAPRHGRLLAEAARAAGSPVELVESARARHNEIFDDDPSLPGRIAQFLRGATAA